AHIEILHADMTRLPLSDAVVNCAAADLPFGQLMGDHETNVNLYPRVLNEMARVMAPGGRFVVITHEMRLMDRLLSKNHLWTSEQAIQVNLRGLHPKIYVLRRTMSRV
ncbi:MAG: RNA methyltransferase, partial [Anaerolinea sp.]|nr:RNA methyltransferase [Anaerolinea sp.]